MPPPSDFTIVLQRVDGAGQSSCIGFTVPSIPLPARFAVISDPQNRAAADDLHACLKQRFSSLGPADGCTGPGLTACWATRGAATNLLVVVAGGQGPSTWLETTLADWRGQGMSAVGVVHRRDNPASVLPSSMVNEVAVLWDRSTCEVANEIVELGLMPRDDRRVFISYAHVDGAALAEPVFNELSQLRFDVFLDRFRTRPGANFVERIQEELADKAMVLVIETPAALGSAWVRHEVQTALVRRLGLAALSPSPSGGFKSIAEGFRFRFSGTIDLNAMSSFVIERHRVALLYRRLVLTRSLARAFSDPKDATFSVVGADSEVVTKSGRRFEVGLSPRPATVNLARQIAIRASQAGAQPVVVHPVSPVSDRRADTSWVLSNAGITEVDEGRILDFALQVRSGTI